MTVEALVRPFQTQDTTPPRRVVPSGARARSRVRIIVGAGGSAKTLSGSYSISVSRYMDTAYAERSILAGSFIPLPRTIDGFSTTTVTFG